ncbi:hypothetical protein NCAST_05_03930 [Nocardia asteroides NBRC 15531]|uniref:Uncharacterized protein n=1 Tax=Nocardia asteroides NBRC 15531 TaxID=1110697 RepID=U5E6N6_NOCAS|nr:hypothetical protein NCAST_05_03930 [Nocardia asteroides NBRC 15531]
MKEFMTRLSGPNSRRGEYVAQLGTTSPVVDTVHFTTCFGGRGEGAISGLALLRVD